MGIYFGGISPYNRNNFANGFEAFAYGFMSAYAFQRGYFMPTFCIPRPQFSYNFFQYKPQAYYDYIPFSYNSYSSPAYYEANYTKYRYDNYNFNNYYDFTPYPTTNRYTYKPLFDCNPITRQKVSESTRVSSAKPHNNVMSKDEIKKLISKLCKEMDADEDLINAIIMRESNYNPNAESGAGAKGLMQLMPATAKEMGVNDPYDPEQNIRGGIKYIKKQLKSYNNNLSNALIAYNWGPGNARKYIKGKKTNLPKETRDYVRIVTENYNKLKAERANETA